jgi:hypothetical protein
MVGHQAQGGEGVGGVGGSRRSMWQRGQGRQIRLYTRAPLHPKDPPPP